MAKRKRLEAWANEYSNGLDLYEHNDDARHYAQFYSGATRERVRLVECDESETVVSKADLRALRVVAKAARAYKRRFPNDGYGEPAHVNLLRAVERLKKGTKR